MKLTSLFFALVVLLFCTAASAFGQLRIDFNDRSNDLPVHTQEEFDAFVLSAGGFQSGTTLRYGSVMISLSPLGGNGLDDRRRTSPVNAGDFTAAALLQDFVFNDGATINNTGLSVKIQGLASNQSHTITIWSFDSGSTGNRVSDWTANGVLAKDNYTFNGTVLPMDNSTCRFSFNVISDGVGEILIEGRRDSTSAGNGVFLNALEISPIPDERPPCRTIQHFKPGSNLYGWTGGYTFAEQDQEVAALKEAGVRWARINVVWFAVEPETKGAYDAGLLSLYDHLLQRLGENGIKAIFVTADTPYWASSDPAKFTDAGGHHWNTRYKPTNVQDFADYVAFLANRYNSTGPHAFEIWNEQNETYFWPSGPGAADYLPMLQACYAAIKAVNTNAIVLNGGLTDNSTMSNYMASLYAAGGKPYFDAWSQHMYRRTPQYETAIPILRDIMTNNGDAAKKIWVTEAGWPTYTNASDPSAVSFNRQAHYLTNLFTRLAAYPSVEVGVWYTSRSYDETQKEGSFGLMLPDFTRKPSFYALKDWIATASRVCPPSFINLLCPELLSNGTTRVQFNAEPGFAYTLQTSPNLTQWLNLSTNIASTNAAFVFEDNSGVNAARRFYRVVWP
jgi:hypothetical protein